MKRLLISQKNFVTSLTISMFMLGTISASARPFIGSTTDVVEQQCGECVCSYAITTSYFFWIKIDSTRDLTGVDCSGVF